MDNLSSEDPTTMLATLHADHGLQTWSDDKKRDFARTFDSRVLEARYILTATAEKVQDIAERRKFISARHIKQIDRSLPFQRHVATPNMRRPSDWQTDEASTAQREMLARCRTIAELDQIAEQRAASIIKALPPLNKAVQLIDKDTAAMIVQRDKLQAEAQTLADELDETPTRIAMSEVDQTMTVAAFRQMITDAKSVRDAKIKRLRELAEKGVELEQAISKALFAGLPGLSDAVTETIVAHFERAMALVEIGRRVTEQVLFGDSAAAMKILSTFEHDEVKVNDEMTTKVANAMAKLRAQALSEGKKTSKRSAKKLPAKKGK